MGLEDYLFAIFLFGLGAILILFLLKGLSKNKAERDALLDAKEKKLERMYDEITDLLDALESYIKENKADFTRELEQAKRYLEEIYKTGNIQPAAKIEILKKSEMIEKPSAGKEDLKQRAQNLSRKGYSVGDIAQELGLSRGEITFMLSLTRKSF